MIVLKLIFKGWDGGIDWIDLAQNRDLWRALMNAVLHGEGGMKCMEHID
jgi:hypothetical protein